MIAYQPGGLSERQAILAALENPMEAASIGQAVMTLRKWPAMAEAGGGSGSFDSRPHDFGSWTSAS